MLMIRARAKLQARLMEVCSRTPRYSVKKVGVYTYALIKDTSWLGPGYPVSCIVGLYRVKRTSTGAIYQKKVNKRWYSVDISTI